MGGEGIGGSRDLNNSKTRHHDAVNTCAYSVSMAWFRKAGRQNELSKSHPKAERRCGGDSCCLPARRA